MMRIGLHIRIRMDVDVKTQWMRHYLVSARIPLKWQMHFYSEFVQITKEYTKHISVENNIRRNFPTELLPEFLNSFPIIIGYSFKSSYAHGTVDPDLAWWFQKTSKLSWLTTYVMATPHFLQDGQVRNHRHQVVIRWHYESCRECIKRYHTLGSGYVSASYYFISKSAESNRAPEVRSLRKQPRWSQLT